MTLTHGFVVAAWLILAGNDTPVPFATVEACKRAEHIVTTERRSGMTLRAWCLPAGAK